MISLPRFETGGGAFGNYYQLSNSVGVKVLKSRTYSTAKRALNSHTYKRAMKESYLLTYAYESGVVPRCYGVTLVKQKGKYAIGILMQHLGNKTLHCHGKEFSLAYDTVNDALKDIGIIHNDLHESNIMVYKNNFYAIDFSPECVIIK